MSMLASLRGLRRLPLSPTVRNISSTSLRRAKTAAPKVESVLSTLNVQAERIKTYKPITPSIRHLRRPISPHLYEGRPLRALTVAKRKKGGRNSQGKITVRHIGGGHKQRIRVVDFSRVEGGPQDVIRVEYDPGRSAHIALVRSRNPKSLQPVSYILAPEGLRAGDVVQSYRTGIPKGFVEGYVDKPAPSKKQRGEALRKATTTSTAPLTPAADNSTPFAPRPIDFTLPVDPASPQSVLPPNLSPIENSNTTLSIGVLRSLTIKTGNVLPLRLIPSGTIIHNVSLDPRGAGILCRSAGSFAQVVAHDDKEKYTQVRLMSGEVRNVLQNCFATIGKVSNGDWKLRQLGKAGRSRWLGRRPSVRGMAMNACDHPHGGGRGKSKGNKHPRSVWGWLKGKRTRRPSDKDGNKMVIHQRPRGKDKRKSS